MDIHKRGLILEGGAMRGMFTCGVIDVFMENGIDFDGAAGISAGATFGCNYKSRQIGRAIRYNKKYSRDWRYCSLRSLIKTGDLYGAEFCYHMMPDVLDPFDTETFKNNPMDDIDRKKALGEVFVIRPPEDPGIGRTEKDPEELERVYQMGRREAARRLDEMKTFLCLM